ncbi:MAG: GntR family transcriptional regulator [Deltaproteobacteria bacterium]|nr:GntR family transcriptional regulator [Deltaproteobacteria bacterium]
MIIGFKNRSIPLYYQVETILREKISSGEYQPGDPFPTEDQLVQSYQVSRVTVRQALASIEKDGLISRKRGKGSVVMKGKLHLEPMKLTGMIEDIIAMGIKTKTKIINFGFVFPLKKVTESLKLNENDKVLRVERIRLIKESPVSYTLSYIPPDLGKKISIKDLTVQPMLDVLEKKCKVEIARGFQIIEATVADSRVASFLDVMTGAPLLKIERTVFDIKNRPVEYISILYRSDRYHYSVDLVRKRSESKVRWDHIQISKK